jgi:hypothetical protein
MYEIDHFTTLACVLNITRTEKLSEISKQKYDGVSIFKLTMILQGWIKMEKCRVPSDRLSHEYRSTLRGRSSARWWWMARIYPYGHQTLLITRVNHLSLE